jgi:hypothetical protein
MVQSQSSLGGNSTLKEANKPSGAAYASAATRDGESFMLSGAEMSTNVIKVKVALPFTSNDHVSPYHALDNSLGDGPQLLHQIR